MKQAYAEPGSLGNYPPFNLTAVAFAGFIPPPPTHTFFKKMKPGTEGEKERLRQSILLLTVPDGDNVITDPLRNG